MNQTRLSKGFDENCKTPSISALLIQCMLNNRMGKRYYGLDIAKGISVLGMVLSHSFMGTAAKWKSSILFSLVAKIPTVLLYVLMVPICLFSQMGSLFSLISAICVTQSFLNVSKKGFGVVWRYLLMKMVYAFLLRGIEIFWNQWTVDWDFFETGKMQLPVVDIPFYSHTLDCIGLIGWFVPLLIYLIRLVPFLKDYRIQVAILYVLSVVITIFSRDMASAGVRAEEYCRTNNLYFFAYLFSKIGKGPFQIPQLLPFGLMGGAIGIILHSTVVLSPLWWFFLLSTVGNVIIGGILLTHVDDFVTELFESFKPEGFMIIIASVQFLFILICMVLVDDTKRSPAKRYRVLHHTTFLRRINTLSLSAYVLEPFLSKQVFLVLQLPELFGTAIDYEKEECLWSWPVVALYSFLVVLLAIFIARIWEYGDFRFSIEYQLGFLMQWLFGRSCDKVDYKKNIYGPLRELQEEIANPRVSAVDVVTDEMD